ncbi:MAG: hypothetical protein AAGJ46_14800 [Planctomycetota bacterium]
MNRGKAKTIDSVDEFAPSSMLVDTVTGQMTIGGAEDIIGYEITGPQGALDPAGWSKGNLDSQNYGSPVPATADFNNDGLSTPLTIPSGETALAGARQATRMVTSRQASRTMLLGGSSSASQSGRGSPGRP